MKNGYWIALLSCMVFTGCQQQNEEDKVKEVEKDGSVEMKVEVSHLDSLYDVMKTEKIFWVKGREEKTVVNLDTIPSLGMTTETVKTSSGEDTTARINKNYKIFITVK
jgi:hypothetical protein|nr:hypothetical protein [uncultured organism]